VGGICARRPRNSRICFDFLEEGREYRVSLYADDLSDERPFDVAEGSLPAPDAALVAELEAMSQRPAHHQHDMHAMRIEELTVRKGDVLTVPLSVNGGFAMVVE
jgi:hypothetical protein